MYTDETLNCVDCNAAFIFSAGEQEFFAQKGFANKPNRCPDCRAARKANKSGGGGGNYSSGGGGGRGGYGARAPREMFQATCSGCGEGPSTTPGAAGTGRERCATGPTARHC